MIKFNCTECGEKLESPSSLQGKSLRCPMCKTRVKVPVVAPKKPIVRKTGNILLRAWRNSPAPFRTAFLATFGVISALVLAFYIYGLSQRLSSPPPPRYTSPPPYQPSFTEPATLPESEREPIPPTQPEIVADMEMELLASAVQIYERCNSLDILQNIRIFAAQKYSHNLQAMIHALSCSQDQLEDLYFNTQKLKVPVNANLEKAYNDILKAIEAEYTFQKSIISLANEPDSVRLMAEVKRKSEDVTKLSIDAALSSVFAMDAINHAYFEAYLKVTQIK